ncbi:hypothetical protein A2773_02365 [Candidatus Gottesmanbacteria bacterium RIFCSPHIGHO2_01_FULL_39_10]|uniref:Uncharacterized protein n=1 Tax=Candidatus Gottesmanbacteria bacterium RIFCSPHIGHO2_01_FULL_39_10 TaxID=1798375 RepID=A0A1F5ZQ87_9BACT|nr:MAG: hypothetical protein A2773_02365 [Candidatus Gottesmanbacteria bacterium RIFCSPHIGHO2_01_FULL_39_10]
MAGVKRIIGGTFEFIKDTAKQGAAIPKDVLGGMLEQAVKGVQQTPAQKQQAAKQAQQQMQQNAQQHKVKDEEELKKTREALAGLRAMQTQFAPRKQAPPSIYEQNMQELEKKKAQQVEAGKKQPMAVPTSKQSRGMLFAKKKPKGSEGLTKDSKVG